LKGSSIDSNRLGKGGECANHEVKNAELSPAVNTGSFIAVSLVKVFICAILHVITGLDVPVYEKQRAKKCVGRSQSTTNSKG
jgi:hypothetical protein